MAKGRSFCDFLVILHTMNRVATKRAKKKKVRQSCEVIRLRDESERVSYGVEQATYYGQCCYDSRKEEVG